MSYILDALKKSDRDCDRHRQAPLAAITGTPEFRAGRRGGASKFRALGVIALVLGAAWGGFGLARLEPRLDSRSTVQTLPLQVVPPASVPTPAAPAASNARPLIAAPTTDASLASAGSASVLDEPSTTASAEADTREGLLELWQLTDAEQKYLQGLEVSFHVHSNDPAQRAVIINGLRAKEGQELGEDLRLAEIVPDGIILEFQGQRVHLGNPQPY